MNQSKIEILTRQLLDCGYHAEQIKHIMSEALENSTDDSQEETIMEVLETYLAFAAKCKMTGK